MTKRSCWVSKRKYESTAFCKRHLYNFNYVYCYNFIINCSLNRILCKLNFIPDALSVGKSTTCNGFGTLPLRSWDMFLWMSGDFCTSCRGIPGGRIGGRRFCGVKLWMLRLLYQISSGTAAMCKGGLQSENLNISGSSLKQPPGKPKSGECQTLATFSSEPNTARLLGSGAGTDGCFSGN